MACFGSLAVEVITYIQAYEGNPQRLPQRYTKKGYWVARVLLAMMAGVLAVAYEINKPLLAINIGASAPLLYRALARGIRQDP